MDKAKAEYNFEKNTKKLMVNKKNMKIFQINKKKEK